MMVKTISKEITQENRGDVKESNPSFLVYRKYQQTTIAVLA